MIPQINTGKHIPCVVDVETTGLDFKEDNLIQICVLPVTNEIKPMEDIKPFYVNIKPIYPISKNNKALKINKINLTDLEKFGLESEQAMDSFQEWCEFELGLTDYIKITPLGQNYQFDKGFICEWLGDLNYNYRFHYHYRDTMIAAQFLNDVKTTQGHKKYFSSVSATRLCEKFQIQNPAAHDALQDCYAEAEIYRHLLKDIQLILEE